MATDPQLLDAIRARDRAAWRGQVPEKLFARLEPSPEIGAALCALGDALLKKLDGEVLEFVALRVSAARECQYVWRGHCVIALARREGALTKQQIARLAAGPALLRGRERRLVEAIDELLAGRVLSEAAAADLGKLALELAVAVQFYAMVSTIMRTAEPDAPAVTWLETPEAAAASLRR